MDTPSGTETDLPEHFVRAGCGLFWVHIRGAGVKYKYLIPMCVIIEYALCSRLYTTGLRLPREFRQYQKGDQMGKRGGHNKKKDCTFWYIRYDAQSEIDEVISGQAAHEVKAGCAIQKRFSCPKCNGDVRYLYEIASGIVCCRKCANLNYPSQQWSELEFTKYKIFQILQRMDVDTWNFDNWLEVIRFKPVKPDYMSEMKFFLLDNERVKWLTVFFNCSKIE